MTLEVTKNEWYTTEVEVEGLDEILEKVYGGIPLTDEEVLLLFDTKDDFHDLAVQADDSGEYEMEVKCSDLDTPEIIEHEDRYDDLCNARNKIRRQEYEKERMERNRLQRER